MLLAEAIESLVVRPGGFYVDATFGRGGHSRAILERLGPAGRLAAFDRDPAAVERFGLFDRFFVNAEVSADGALSPSVARAR